MYLLTRLPDELIVAIEEHLKCETDLHHFSLTCRCIYKPINPRLFGTMSASSMEEDLLSHEVQKRGGCSQIHCKWGQFRVVGARDHPLRRSKGVPGVLILQVLTQHGQTSHQEKNMNRLPLKPALRAQMNM